MKTLVIGASIAGIAVAYRLSQAGHKVVLLDSKNSLFTADSDAHTAVLAADDPTMLELFHQWTENGWSFPVERQLVDSQDAKLAEIAKRPVQFDWLQAEPCFYHLLKDVRIFTRQTIESITKRRSGLFANTARHTQLGPFNRVIDARHGGEATREMWCQLQLNKKPNIDMLKSMAKQMRANVLISSPSRHAKYALTARKQVPLSQKRRLQQAIAYWQSTVAGFSQAFESNRELQHTHFNCERFDPDLVEICHNKAAHRLDFQNQFLSGHEFAESLLLARH
ncbi:FAD-dependent oxidoreductase [Gayadomonas joobiniege]|uniref:FAD-dependent oxidoreductase n=1 Tax=Gayadomonas joobiniege TaxID=1234606 RepID=UPI00037FC541|nr:FAD-dependent oxidoreductase [Gayadomonas joobiniege]